ncbi:MAG: hypothetical protein GY806_06125 [Gammaproteobacteria bacterium]|nr:hypothetical protein [Gammaproteobacteria bacterium]
MRVRSVSYFYLLILFNFLIFQAHAAGGLRQAEIEKFRLECWSNPAYDLELKFAPVRRLTDESRRQGSWSYEFTSDNNRYPEERVSLPEKGAVRVDLVTQLNQKDSDFGEGYLWNVIVAPKVRNWRFGGHWPVKKSITEYQRMADKRDSLISVASLSVYNGHPVHTLISPKDIDSAGTLNGAWESLFGEKIVSRLVYPASKGRDGYSLTFYYMPIPSLQLINHEGYRWPSFKHVDRKGKVYGFVLTADGECLASASVEVQAGS